MISGRKPLRFSELREGVRKYPRMGPQLPCPRSTRASRSRGRQAAALVVVQTEPPATELLSQGPVLLLEMLDDVFPVLIDPTGEREQDEVE